MSNTPIAPQKKIQGVGDSYSVLLLYLHLSKMVYESYSTKDNSGSISGIIITRRGIIRVSRRENIFIFIKHDDLKESELQCVKSWVRVDTEGFEAHVFEYIKYKKSDREVAVEYNAHDTTMEVLHACTERAEHIQIITTSTQEVDNVILDQLRLLVKRYSVP